MKRTRNAIAALMVVLFSGCIFTACSTKDITGSLLDSLQNKLYGSSEEISYDTQENASASGESEDDAQVVYSKVTFESGINTLFYYVAEDLGLLGGNHALMTFYYDTSAVKVTSAKVAFIMLNDSDIAQTVFDAINDNSKVSLFLSNPEIVYDEEAVNSGESPVYPYSVTADLDLSKVKVNSFIDANFLSCQNIYALQEDILSRDSMVGCEIGDNYTYDHFDDMRIEWFP